jgi:hypothetical protein
MNKHIRIAAAVLLTALVAVPMFAARGSADFSRLVILGDSYGAGVESGSLNERHQPWSWGAVLARQVGYTICPGTAVATDSCFAVPLAESASVFSHGVRPSQATRAPTRMRQGRSKE